MHLMHTNQGNTDNNNFTICKDRTGHDFNLLTDGQTQALRVMNYCPYVINRFPCLV